MFKRLTWPAAIERALDESDRPLTAAEIANRALHEGWVARRSDSPSYSVKGAIHDHIKRGNGRGFMVAGRGPSLEYLYWLLRKSSNNG